MAYGGQAQIWKSTSLDDLVTVHNYKVCRLTFGDNHCIFTTASGHVYGYGEGEHGQLGTSNTRSHFKEPVQVSLPQCNSERTCPDCAAVDISCGPKHSAAVLKNGSVYMWGSNNSGQCGVDQPVVLAPYHVKFIEDGDEESPLNHPQIYCHHNDPSKVFIVAISCGAEHTMALSSKHEVWAWGKGSAQLGLISVLWTFKPLKVPFLHQKKVLSVSCGLSHTAVLVQKSNISAVDCDNKDTVICSQCQFGHNTENKELAVSKICPLGLPVHIASELSAVSLNGLVDDKSFTLEDDNELKMDSLLLNDGRSVPESSHNDEIETVLPSDPVHNIDIKSTSENDTCTETNSSVHKENFVPESDQPSSLNVFEVQSTKAFLSKLDTDNDSVIEKTSLKNSVLSATTDALSGFYNSMNEKFEMLVHMQAPPTPQPSDESVELFEISGEAKPTVDIEEFSEDFTPENLKSLSLKALDESGLLAKQLNEKCSSSLDRLLLDNKKKHRTRTHSQISFSSKASCQSSLAMKGNVQTELWTWGKGRQGQLGHGDMLERIQPCIVQSLVNKNVVKVLAAGNHTVAMTSDSRIFTWGSNSCGQLGHSYSVPSVCSPAKIQLLGSTLVWDIAANDESTTFLADGYGKQVGVFNCGGKSHQESEEFFDASSRQPQHLNTLKKGTNICRIYGGGKYSGYICDIDSSTSFKLLHEFAVCEKNYANSLQMISEQIFKPLLHHELMSAESICVTALKALIGVHTELCDTATLNCFDLIQLFQEGSKVFSSCEIMSIFMLDEADEYMTLIKKYVSLFCDCIAVDAISFIVKTLSAFVDQVQPLLNEIFQMALPAPSKSADPANILQHLLEIPCKHISNYSNYLSKFLSEYKKGTQEHSMLEGLSNDYLEFSVQYENQMKKAISTQKFWESCPYKVAEYLKEHERRFIKDSKSHPLTLHAASRFSSHWFILFNDVFIHSQFSGVQAYYLTTMWIDIVTESEILVNSFSVTTPEEVLILSCPSSQLKTEWICSLNQGIKNALSSSCQSKEHRLSPPLARYSHHLFHKQSPYKDAVYTGMWMWGKLHGEGTLEWPNGKKYVGKFKENLQHGHGILTIPSNLGNSSVTVYEGEWKNGQLNGLGTVKYPNGDVYEGYFKEGMRNGHGVLKKGQFLSTAASVYVGQWLNNCRHGYGVNDDVMAGEKYLGWWENDFRHGNGVVVTIDGIYYEGSFYQNKMQGYGLVIFEDNTSYEGDLTGHGIFNGKGSLNLSNGDHIEGNFSGKWNDGVRINGTYFKSVHNTSYRHTSSKRLPKSFAKLSVHVAKKWGDIFTQCSIMLGVAYSPFDYDVKSEVTAKAWENIAITIDNWKKILKKNTHSTSVPKKHLNFSLEHLDVIPKQSSLLHKAVLLAGDFEEIRSYLSRAFDCIYHPIGQMIDQLVDVFRATYIGVGAHPKLLIHAVEEVRSYIKRIYMLTRIIYPVLPKLNDSPKVILPHSPCLNDREESLEDDDCSREVVTPFSLLLPLLLPRIYSPLFMLYALDNEYSDEKYWERLLKWNKQSDITLMTFLGVDQKFWLKKSENFVEKHQNLSAVKDKYFSQSVEALQHLSTTFSPQEKLEVIHQTFDEINKTVENYLGKTVMWTMDELFPLFQFTVIRARIRHLGSEVNFIEDFMEKRLENGELGLMFTTLKASYFQIQNEKVNW